MKGDANTFFRLPLNLDEYDKQNSELIRRPSIFLSIEAVRLTTFHFFRGLFIIWIHITANSLILSYQALPESPNQDRGRLKMDSFLFIVHTDTPSTEKKFGLLKCNLRVILQVNTESFSYLIIFFFLIKMLSNIEMKTQGQMTKSLTSKVLGSHSHFGQNFKSNSSLLLHLYIQIGLLSQPASWLL